MALDALFGLEDEHAVFVVGFGPDGRAAGFLHFALSPAGRALSLSSMPRLRDDAERLQRVADLRGDRAGRATQATSASR